MAQECKECGYGIKSHNACPDCGKHTRMIYFDYEWYGRESTCLRCGRHWSGGEWMPLCFERGARRKSIDAAKRRYRELRYSGLAHTGKE